jgi:hypothetical protein
VPSKRGGLAVASISQSVNGNITYLDEENEEKNLIVYLIITKNTIKKIMNGLLNDQGHLQDTI